MTLSDHIPQMRHALRLAERGLGRVAPNPSVGCVILARDGRVAGRGWTAPGGRPHAEALALAAAGEAARGGTAYITLEPCAHHGETPPCTDALIAAAVARVVIATGDPDPRVNGKGIAQLQAACIEVVQGVCESEAAYLNEGFFTRIQKSRPLVALKIAQSADGLIADADGRSQWITSETARRHGHFLRATHDALLVGIKTVLADDPRLTCRLDGLDRCSPVRAVLDRDLRLPLDSKLVRGACDGSLIVFTSKSGGDAELRRAGVDVVRTQADGEGRPDIAAVLENLAGRGITRLLVEGGPTVHASLLQRGLVDRLHLYRAPMLLGAGARSAVGALCRGLADAPRLQFVSGQRFGPDLLETFQVSS